MATKKKRYLDITNGVEVPRYYSRMDATYAPQRKIDEKANARFDQQAVNAKNDKERTKAIHAKDNYNRNRTRYRQVVTSGRDFTRAQKAKQNKVDTNKKAFQQLSQAMASDMNYSYMEPNGYIYDKDALDRARNQQNWLQNSIWTVGSGWEKRAANMNPYTDQDLIAHAYESASSMPRLVGEVGTTLVPAIGSPGKVLKAVGASYLGSKATDLGIRTFSNYKGWNDMASKKWGWSDTEGSITNPGMWLGGLGYGRLSGAWNNPNSLLSKNIRTSFFNRKVPLGYDLRDANNIMPYLEGTYNTLLRRKIPQMNQNESIYKYMKWMNDNNIWKEKLPENYFPKPKKGQTVEQYMQSYPIDVQDAARMSSNRVVSWDKYLGLDKYKHAPLYYDNGNNMFAKTKYTPNENGTYTVNLTNDDAVLGEFLYGARPNAKTGYPFNSNGRFVGEDVILGNHGGMNGRLSLGTTPNSIKVSASDVFDLMPFHKLNTTKIYKYIPKNIRNFEISKMMPSGAKPFEAKFDFNGEYPLGHNYYPTDTREYNFTKFIDNMNKYLYVDPKKQKRQYVGRM